MNIPGTAVRAARPLQDVARTPVRQPSRRCVRLLRLRRALFRAVAYDFGRLPAGGRRPVRRPDGVRPH